MHGTPVHGSTREAPTTPHPTCVYERLFKSTHLFCLSFEKDFLNKEWRYIDRKIRVIIEEKIYLGLCTEKKG